MNYSRLDFYVRVFDYLMRLRLPSMNR